MSNELKIKQQLLDVKYKRDFNFHETSPANEYPLYSSFISETASDSQEKAIIVSRPSRGAYSFKRVSSDKYFSKQLEKEAVYFNKVLDLLKPYLLEEVVYPYSIESNECIDDFLSNKLYISHDSFGKIRDELFVIWKKFKKATSP